MMGVYLSIYFECPHIVPTVVAFCERLVFVVVVVAALIASFRGIVYLGKIILNTYAPARVDSIRQL